MCAPLLENIEMVRRGEAEQRVSDAVAVTGRRRRGVSVTPGDFEGVLTLDELRSCLGADWVEDHATSLAQYRGDVSVFNRTGWPMVFYVQSRARRSVANETQIRIEAAQ